MPLKNQKGWKCNHNKTANFLDAYKYFKSYLICYQPVDLHDPSREGSHCQMIKIWYHFHFIVITPPNPTNTLNYTAYKDQSLLVLRTSWNALQIFLEETCHFFNKTFSLQRESRHCKYNSIRHTYAQAASGDTVFFHIGRLRFRRLYCNMIILYCQSIYTCQSCVAFLLVDAK